MEVRAVEEETADGRNALIVPLRRIGQRSGVSRLQARMVAIAPLQTPPAVAGYRVGHTEQGLAPGWRAKMTAGHWTC